MELLYVLADQLGDNRVLRERRNWIQDHFSVYKVKRGTRSMSIAKILVVEDDRIVANDIENILRDTGYEVPAVLSSGEQAIEKAVELQPDLVLMDIVLQGKMNGVEAAEQIRLRLDIPVVYLTTYADCKILQIADIPEAFGHLHKPFQETELLSTIEVALYKHNMERRLRETKRWFANTIESIDEGVITADRDGVITLMNPVAEALTGWEEESGVGRPLKDVFHIIHKGKAEHAEDPVRRILQEGIVAVLRNQVVIIARDGREILIGYSAVPSRDDQGKIIGIILAFHDVTEQKILESQLVQAQKLEAIGQLAAGIAHEINTPIQYVGDNTRFFQDAFNDLSRLLERYDQLFNAMKTGVTTDDILQEVEATAKRIDLTYLTEEIPKAIQQTLEGVERVAKIVRAMKEFSHPGTGEKTPVDINKAIENTITVSKNEWKYVADMVKDFDSSLPLVPCLPGEFNQVILNMIINASHAIADVVGDGSAGKGVIRVSTRHQGDWAEIRISDTGTGIPDQIRTRIFDPFFTTKKVGKGTGQGLAISHSVIVTKHGGAITFDTDVGIGTTFIIQLPITNGIESEGSNGTSPILPCGRQKGKQSIQRDMK